ncbi:heterokaryon incompatibility protein-domain-containing protein [Leptodontidium sp. MPI-SDFR-AT-0119]|nr:heterokaryon incompatibility protein-domain-containing protein [Leptodontidium sp. MPI-SDFR-AT-0119]
MLYQSSIPAYAILSHTWGRDEEVTFKDIQDHPEQAKSEAGYRKIELSGKQAACDGLEYFWVDTRCIDKSNNAELAEAINSMFRWYRNAAKCYVYLADVAMGSLDNVDKALQKSRWFTRGWTLQELIAPGSVEFFSSDDKRLDDKKSLEQQLFNITGVALEALRGDPLDSFSVEQRMAWAEKRTTKKEEDKAYSLLGIFNVFMPLIYSEGTEMNSIDLRKKSRNTQLRLLLTKLSKRSRLSWKRTQEDAS